MRNVFRYEVKIRAGLALAACIVFALFLIAASPATASAAGTIVIIVQAAPGGPDAFPFSATGQVNQNFSLVDNGVAGTNTQTLTNVPAGLTTITRGGTYLYDLTAINCSVTGGSNVSPNIAAQLVSINLIDGDTVICTFFNSTVAPIVKSTADGPGNAADCAGLGVCTLRSAIMFANEDPFMARYKIKFNIPTTDPGYDPVTNSYTITLLTALPSINNSNNAEISILGPGAKRLTVRRSPAAPPFSIFTIEVGRTVGIDGVTVSGGMAFVGGGIRNGGSLTLRESVVSGNSANSGGGIQNSGSLLVQSSLVSGNTANEYGGGIAGSGSITIVNSTITNNSADIGGAIFGFSGAELDVASTTITANSANLVGGIASPQRIIFNSSIAANNLSSDDNVDIHALFQGVLGSHNLIEVTNAQVTGSANIFGTDPMLGPMQDNGGPTFTHALLPGSPAIDTGNSTLTRDQRGLFRPVDDPGSPNGVGNLADIGAFEVQLPFVADADGDGVLDDVDRCLGTVLPEARPAGLKKNHFYADASGNFIDANNSLSGITVVDTGGCSGRQIIDAAGLGDGHIKFGITRGALLDWIAPPPLGRFRN